MAELRPYPFGALITRMFRESERKRAIFDLPLRKAFFGDSSRDLSVSFHGRRASTALGPAAGPQSQMAQNIVLSWLGGCRIFELKTVQIDDALRIPRPCIDMQTIGYNIEWSQELKLEQSLEEYVKGAMLVEILRASGELPLVPGFEHVIYDMSVGYDLAGIRSERVGAFLRGMLDASAVVAKLRAEIPIEYRRYRDLDFPVRLSDTLTLSTFHGCPPKEIERIIEYMLEEYGLQCIVKFNPMLLGKARTRELLHEVMGYHEIRVPDSAFEKDTKWEDAVALMDRLGDRAEQLGLSVGAKFTNTLVVENHREFFPPGEKQMYLSGPPLHVLAMNLVRDFRRVFADRFPISFSAGIDRKNFADAVALGLVPVTVCSDLLAPGGYGRARGYLDELVRRMEAVGAKTVEELVQRAFAHEGGSISEAKVHNSEVYVAEVNGDPRYHREANQKAPRKIGRRLELFDCITCDKCVPVCPNDANFTFIVPCQTIPVTKVRREANRWVSRQEGTLRIEEAHQIGTFADFCNDCGNCDVFCPEDGGPYKVKPRFFGSLGDWRRLSHLDGFHLERTRDGTIFRGRIGGAEYAVEHGNGSVRFLGEGFALELDESDPMGSIRGDARGEVDLTWYHVLCSIRDAVYAPGETNYLSCRTALE